MTSFTISTPNSKCDSEGVYKNFLLKRLLLSYPELAIDGIDSEESPYSYQYVGPSNRIGFGASRYSPCDVAKYKKCTYCPFDNDVEDYNLATDFERALKRLDDYGKMTRGYKPLYDFKLEDGTPVKEYANFIQVGYKLIPKSNSLGYIRSLPKEDRIVINNVIVMINNNTEINAVVSL